MHKTAITNNLILNHDSGTVGTYTSLNQFGEVVDQNWTVNSSIIDQYQYGYDRNGNRLYHKNTQSVTKSDYHAYDNLDRLTHTDHGTLNVGLTAITTLASAQDWTLDELANRSTFKADNDASINYNSSGDLNQARAHNAANETGTFTPPSTPLATGDTRRSHGEYPRGKRCVDGDGTPTTPPPPTLTTTFRPDRQPHTHTLRSTKSPQTRLVASERGNIP